MTALPTYSLAGLATADLSAYTDDEVADIWSAAYAARQRERRKPIPRTLRQAVYARDGHRCVQCGATERLTLDHYEPWSLGGPDTFENLRTLCAPCNNARTVDDYFAEVQADSIMRRLDAGEPLEEIVG